MTGKDYKKKTSHLKQGYIAKSINVTEGYLSQIFTERIPVTKKMEHLLKEFLNKHNIN